MSSDKKIPFGNGIKNSLAAIQEFCKLGVSAQPLPKYSHDQKSVTSYFNGIK